MREILAHFKLFHESNTKIVSNFLAFDADTGKVSGIEGPMIHVFNKNESAVHDSPYFKEISDRHHIILLGDSVGDLKMADGAAEDAEAMLSVGFLNHHFEERLNEYMDRFDVVLVDDQSMDAVNAVLGEILKPEEERS